VAVLIDNEGKLGVMGHYPYVASKYSDKELNKDFYTYIEGTKTIAEANPNTKYTLYLFGGSPMNGSANAIKEAGEAKIAVKNAFNDALGRQIENVVDKTSAGLETLDWLIADIKNKEITYHYYNAPETIPAFSSSVMALEPVQSVGSPVRQAKILTSAIGAMTGSSPVLREEGPSSLKQGPFFKNILGISRQQRVSRLIKDIEGGISPVKVEKRITQLFGKDYIPYYQKYPTGFSNFLKDGYSLEDNDERFIENVLVLYENYPELARSMIKGNEDPYYIGIAGNIFAKHKEAACQG
jgi:hypothetical protein